MRVNPNFNVRLLTLAKLDPIMRRAPSEPTLIVVDGHDEYIIQRFIDSNWLGKHFQYKVTYKGYGKEHDEWLFRDDLMEDLGRESLEDFKEFYEQNQEAK